MGGKCPGSADPSQTNAQNFRGVKVIGYRLRIKDNLRA